MCYVSQCVKLFIVHEDRQSERQEVGGSGSTLWCKGRYDGMKQGSVETERERGVEVEEDAHGRLSTLLRQASSSAG